jgi:hypothetical protein
VSEEKRLSFSDILSQCASEKEHKVYVEELGGTIPYKDLTLEDFREIMQKQGDPVEMSKLALFKAWSKADPTVTLEGINKIPARIILGVINEIAPVLFGTVPLSANLQERQ